MVGIDGRLQTGFLLTRLLRGATGYGKAMVDLNRFLLTRLLRGPTKQEAEAAKAAEDFYSHASCEARR